MSWEEEPTGGGGAEQGTEMGEGRPRRARGALPAPTTRPHPSRSYPRAVPAPRVRRDEGLPLRPAEARGLGRRRVAASEEEEDCKAALLARQRRSSPGGTHEAPGASASGHPSFGNEMCAMPVLLPAAPPPRPLLLHRSICSCASRRIYSGQEKELQANPAFRRDPGEQALPGPFTGVF